MTGQEANEVGGISDANAKLIAKLAAAAYGAANRDAHARWIIALMGGIVVGIMYTICLTRYLAIPIDGMRESLGFEVRNLSSRVDSLDSKISRLSNDIHIGNQTVTVERQRGQVDVIEAELIRRRNDKLLKEGPSDGLR